ncbi:MAG: glycosyltransferase [Verrucomicrobiaceae bacterium]|nr:MAG: glycosyltransferase [Verrucomicrobiaceae bacterium]
MGPEIVIASAALHTGISLALLARMAPARAPGRGVIGQKVSIIIPARNEAHHLPRLLDSIPSDLPLEIIVADDGSDDGTAHVAEKHGARVIACGTPPPGWIGKSWACWQGANAAKGDVLLFLDADCWFSPGGYEKLLECHRGGAMSVLPWHEVRKPVEQLSAFFNLVMAASNLGTDLFGQCLCVGKEDYRKAGGHAAVKDCILETVMLGKLLRDAGVSVSSIPGEGLLLMRMYPDGLKQIIDGWSKGFAQGASTVTPGRMLMITAFLGGLFLPMVVPFVFPWLAPLYLLYAGTLFLLFRRIGSFSWWAAVLFPVPMLFYQIVFLRALAGAGKKTQWKGRPVHAP